jgi:sporulation protein YlmC with PRC-barrel domain
MMKQLLMATAASGLMLSTALAQNSAPPSNPPAASPPAATKGLESTPPAAAGKDMSKPAAAASAGQQIISSQTPDQMLASKFSGTDVVGADDKKIGDVSDVLFDKDGKILAYVVSIGGFLGIGSKDVALAPSAFELVKGSQGASDKLRISMSQEQLKQMASFEPYQPPRPTTTGTAPSGTSPRPSPTR